MMFSRHPCSFVATNNAASGCAKCYRRCERYLVINPFAVAESARIAEKCVSMRGSCHQFFSTPPARKKSLVVESPILSLPTRRWQSTVETHVM